MTPRDIALRCFEGNQQSMSTTQRAVYWNTPHMTNRLPREESLPLNRTRPQSSCMACLQIQLRSSVESRPAVHHRHDKHRHRTDDGPVIEDTTNIDIGPMMVQCYVNIYPMFSQYLVCQEIESRAISL